MGWWCGGNYTKTNKVELTINTGAVPLAFARNRATASQTKKAAGPVSTRQLPLEVLT
ncbi:hypothetical protein [Paenibacillus koleovorans]|uniref:hypothetical protein n=1 Tax=Paenibacillus koleovorans TaxID=121608 RepID=UPI0013E32287|nr:hypothetical protein [Paenibacillus koleovorans]